MPINLTNSTDIIAHSVSVVRGNTLLDLLGLIQSLTGVPPSTLDNLEKIAEAIDNNPTYAETITGLLSDKADSSTTYTKNDVDDKFTLLIGNTQLNTLKKLADAIALKADGSTTYNKTEVNDKFTSLVGDTTLNTLKALADAIALKQVNLSVGSTTNNSTPMMNISKTLVKNLLGTGKITVTPDADNTTVNIGTSSLTRSDVALGNVDNTSDNDKVTTSTNPIYQALANKQVNLSTGPVTNNSTPMMNLPKTLVKNLLGTGKITVTPDADNTTVNIGMSSLTKSDVGLGNVDNTSDILKPVSTAVSNELALKQVNLSIGPTTNNSTPMMNLPKTLIKKLVRNW